LFHYYNYYCYCILFLFDFNLKQDFYGKLFCLINYFIGGVFQMQIKKKRNNNLSRIEFFLFKSNDERLGQIKHKRLGCLIKIRDLS